MLRSSVGTFLYIDSFAASFPTVGNIIMHHAVIMILKLQIALHNVYLFIYDCSLTVSSLQAFPGRV